MGFLQALLSSSAMRACVSKWTPLCSHALTPKQDSGRGAAHNVPADAFAVASDASLRVETDSGMQSRSPPKQAQKKKRPVLKNGKKTKKSAKKKAASTHATTTQEG